MGKRIIELKTCTTTTQLAIQFLTTRITTKLVHSAQTSHNNKVFLYILQRHRYLSTYLIHKKTEVWG